VPPAVRDRRVHRANLRALVEGEGAEEARRAQPRAGRARPVRLAVGAVGATARVGEAEVPVDHLLQHPRAAAVAHRSARVGDPVLEPTGRALAAEHERKPAAERLRVEVAQHVAEDHRVRVDAEHVVPQPREPRHRSPADQPAAGPADVDLDAVHLLLARAAPQPGPVPPQVRLPPAVVQAWRALQRGTRGGGAEALSGGAEPRARLPQVGHDEDHG